MPSTLRNATSCITRLTSYFKLLYGEINTTTCSHIKKKKKNLRYCTTATSYSKELASEANNPIADEIMIYHFLSAQ